MGVTKQDVTYIAKLSRLAFNEEETEVFRKEFDGILAHVGKVNRVDTEGVEPCSNVFPLENVLREDEAKPSTDPELLRRSAIEREDTAYLVPKVVEG